MVENMSIQWFWKLQRLFSTQRVKIAVIHNDLAGTFSCNIRSRWQLKESAPRFWGNDTPVSQIETEQGFRLLEEVTFRETKDFVNSTKEIVRSFISHLISHQ